MIKKKNYLLACFILCDIWDPQEDISLNSIIYADTSDKKYDNIDGTSDEKYDEKYVDIDGPKRRKISSSNIY